MVFGLALHLLSSLRSSGACTRSFGRPAFGRWHRLPSTTWVPTLSHAATLSVRCQRGRIQPAGRPTAQHVPASLRPHCFSACGEHHR
jgi:hypothetical protein